MARVLGQTFAHVVRWNQERLQFNNAVFNWNESGFQEDIFPSDTLSNGTNLILLRVIDDNVHNEDAVLSRLLNRSMNGVFALGEDIPSVRNDDQQLSEVFLNRRSCQRVISDPQYFSL